MARESSDDKKRRAGRIIRRLQKAYGDATCALRHRNAFELVAATILSAQCTDERVNIVTPHLFGQYPTAAELARAVPADVEAEGAVRYGSSANVASRLEEPATGLATVILVATDHPADVERAVRSVAAHAPAGTSVVVVADGPSDEASVRAIASKCGASGPVGTFVAGPAATTERAAVMPATRPSR